MMEIFTLKEWEENFDELFARVEKGEHIGIVREDGTAELFIHQKMMNCFEYTRMITTKHVIIIWDCRLKVIDDFPLLITE